jgi:HSP20 family protein
MASFFEKLKKGMGIEESGEIEEASFAKDSENEAEKTKEIRISSRAPLQNQPASREKPVKKKGGRKSKKIEVEEGMVTSPVYSQGKSTVEEKGLEAKAGQKNPPFAPVATENLVGKKDTGVEEKWLETEGELAIDVYQTETDVVVQSAIAGVKPENLDIAIERDILTIRGNREKPFEETGDYFTQECYWGPFSREVVMPVEVDPERVEATMKEGILTIKIPKLLREKLRRIKVKI